MLRTRRVLVAAAAMGVCLWVPAQATSPARQMQPQMKPTTASTDEGQRIQKSMTVSRSS